MASDDLAYFKILLERAFWARSPPGESSSESTDESEKDQKIMTAEECYPHIVKRLALIGPTFASTEPQLHALLVQYMPLIHDAPLMRPSNEPRLSSFYSQMKQELNLSNTGPATLSDEEAMDCIRVLVAGLRAFEHQPHVQKSRQLDQDLARIRRQIFPLLVQVEGATLELGEGTLFDKMVEQSLHNCGDVANKGALLLRMAPFFIVNILAAEVQLSYGFDDYTAGLIQNASWVLGGGALLWHQARLIHMHGFKVKDDKYSQYLCRVEDGNAAFVFFVLVASACFVGRIYLHYHKSQ